MVLVIFKVRRADVVFWMDGRLFYAFMTLWVVPVRRRRRHIPRPQRRVIPHTRELCLAGNLYAHARSRALAIRNSALHLISIFDPISQIVFGARSYRVTALAAQVSRLRLIGNRFPRQTFVQNCCERICAFLLSVTRGPRPPTTPATRATATAAVASASGARRATAAT